VTLETSTHRIIEGQYLRDILDQPRALAATLEQLLIPHDLHSLAQRLREGRFKRLVLTGMGASFHALHPLFLRLNTCGYTAALVETSELVHALGSWLEPESLLVAVSQSGQSAEIVRLLQENKRRAPVVGISNAADSALAKGSDVPLVTLAGEEASVSCKTYVTALMALHLLGEILCGTDESETRDSLAQALPPVASYLEGWKNHADEIAGEIGGIRNLFLLGRGESLAATGDGALIIKESVRMPAEGMSGAAFRHGPLEMVNRETFAIVFAGAEPTRAMQSRLAEDIRRAGGKTAWIGEDAPPGAWHIPGTPAGLRPIIEILPVQMTTLALAAEAGIEAGRFARIPKITTTE
jgi:glucosamine--fructose-6-phosphate aminotransferase (isomerizing)